MGNSWVFRFGFATVAVAAEKDGSFTFSSSISLPPRAIARIETREAVETTIMGDVREALRQAMDWAEAYAEAKPGSQD